MLSNFPLPSAYGPRPEMVWHNRLYEARSECWPLTPLDADKRPRVALCVQIFTSGGPYGTNIYPASTRLYREGLEAFEKALAYWLQPEVRDAYTADNAKVDAAFVTTFFPRDIIVVDLYRDYTLKPVPFDSIDVRLYDHESDDFALLEAMSTYHYQEVMRDSTLESPPMSVRDIPTTMLSLDTDRATVEAFGIGKKLVEIVQSALVRLVFRDYGGAGRAVDHLIGCARALRYLISARERAAERGQELSASDLV